jgi:PAT family beta-lactamase induction signal transducer AmpG
VNRLLITLCLGLSSGLPLALSGSTLQAWFTQGGLSLKDIGFVGIAAFPYTFKFLWAPLMDRWVPPFLDRRRGWILIFQLLLCLAIASMIGFTPKADATYLFAIAFLIALISASQDIVIDAYRIDILAPEQRALGAAMGVNGYRIGMLISGGGSLLIAHYYGWPICFLNMAGLMALGTLAT